MSIMRTARTDKEEKFLKELEDLMNKYNVSITDCGYDSYDLYFEGPEIFTNIIEYYSGKF